MAVKLIGDEGRYYERLKEQFPDVPSVMKLLWMMFNSKPYVEEDGTKIVGQWWVPNSDDDGGYLVTTGPKHCQCTGFSYHRTCIHYEVALQRELLDDEVIKAKVYEDEVPF